MEKSLQDGIISKDSYLATIKGQISHDKLLMEFFLQEDDKVKAAKVKERLGIEIYECQEHSK